MQSSTTHCLIQRQQKQVGTKAESGCSRQHPVDKEKESEGDIKTSNKITTQKKYKSLSSPQCSESSTPDNDADDWEAMYARLQTFKRAKGHCVVEDDATLASWVEKQRQLYNKVNSSLGGTRKPTASEQLILGRIARMNKLGFPWKNDNNSKKRSSWETRFEELLHFVVRNGHTQVPIGWEENVPLSNWVSAQRQGYKSLQKGRYSRLTQARMDMLNSIGFVWEAPKGGPKRQIKDREPIPPTFRAALKSPPPQYLQERARFLLDELAKRRQNRGSIGAAVENGGVPKVSSHLSKEPGIAGSNSGQFSEVLEKRSQLHVPTRPAVAPAGIVNTPNIVHTNYPSRRDVDSMIHNMQQQYLISVNLPITRPRLALYYPPVFGTHLTQQLIASGLISSGQTKGPSALETTTNHARDVAESGSSISASVSRNHALFTSVVGRCKPK